MESLTQLISNYTPIGLDEMKSVKLMKRKDTKYVLPDWLLPNILEKIYDSYKIFEISGTRISRYENLYFDTEDFMFYLKHHQGKLNRHKVRFRKYVDSELCYFEIKFKNNKRMTFKKRIKGEKIDTSINGERENFLTAQTGMNAKSLIPRLWANYSRITLVNKFSPERLTLDLNLNYHLNGMEATFPNLVIAEVKQTKYDRISSPFMRMMKDIRIPENSISKYCLGLTSIFQQLKKNNFKNKFLTLNKILHATPPTTC
ncbi:MAG: hypothetical protein A3H98_09915 [Bacteroidetes bacterium RIFCSPLOWO2_02_FULL_36_8]|nr:MAG: hypothetical protein A3H98_09915 [Bacteroidetes bacterium RIFCSPLOWO2_02_FULL_36_8]OFY70420.1 MAG: hypothetical protein A3G23_09850 [Bacteroidetes bacterium RIFCSPLOWO2_12_FULL_37_12]